MEFIFAVLLLWAIYLAFAQQNRPKQPRYAAAQPAAHTSIKREVVRRLYGDAAAADRLFYYTKSKHPNQSIQWVWEKVLEDLERDRGYR